MSAAGVVLWTAELDGLLRSLRAKGASFSVCAAKVSALAGRSLSRNACIGRAGRLGLPSGPPAAARAVRKRATEIAVKARLEKHPPKRASVPAEERVAPEPGFAPPDGKRLTALVDLGQCMCRWPYDAPPGVMYCGEATGHGESYCLPHALAAVQPDRRAATQAQYGLPRAERQGRDVRPAFDQSVQRAPRRSDEPREPTIGGAW